MLSDLVLVSTGLVQRCWFDGVGLNGVGFGAVGLTVLVQTQRGATDKAPSISYVEGALFHSAPQRALCQDRHARIRQAAIRA